MQSKNNTTSNKVWQLTAISLALVLSFSCAGPDSQHAKKETSASSKHTKQEDTRNQLAVPQTLAMPISDDQNQHQNSQQKPQTLEMTSVRDTTITKQQAHEARALSMVYPSPSQDGIAYYEPSHGNSENYQNIAENGIRKVTAEPLSTFSIDVDTGSYTNTRRMLNQGYLPPADAIRIEEFINYFDYNYQKPTSSDVPFSVNTALSVAPWNSQRHLLRIALKGYKAEQSTNIARNLVFLLDVSGSMNQANKLPLLKRSLLMLSQQLTEQDSVSIVVYAGASGVVLPATAGNNTPAISQALSNLQAGGSTNGGAGIQQAYALAEKAFKKEGVNRVILATDGDFNVGMTDQQALLDLIKQKRNKGIALTTLGFGQGNYNDYLMEQLADAGNGNYAYIDNIFEARKVLVDELDATMQIIAKDVKIQVEFNPQTVAEYRLIGYENRQLKQEDFNNDKVDAGDIGAGHRVTALYELSLVGSQGQYIDELRYDKSEQKSASADKGAKFVDELAFIKLRYKDAKSETSQLITQTVSKEQIIDFDMQSDDFRFATAVASFAQHLKSSQFSPTLDYDWIANTALAAKGEDEFGYRSEFVQLVQNTKHLSQIN